MALLGVRQLFPQNNGNPPVDEYRAVLAAFPFDGNGVLPEGLLRCGGADAKARADAQANVADQIEGQDEVVALLSSASPSRLLNST